MFQRACSIILAGKEQAGWCRFLPRHLTGWRTVSFPFDLRGSCYYRPMKIRPAIIRRIVLAVAVIVLLTGIGLGIVALLLTFADTYSVPEGTRCAPSFWKSQWPKYIGCAMAAHQDLAAGLIGGAAALLAAGVAAWVAFAGIQEQLAEEREREERLRAQEIAALKASIYSDIADRAARCLNDYISPWRDLRSDDRWLTAERVEMFRPATPVVYPAIAGKVGLLKAEVLVPVTQFYFRLDALSHAIESLIGILRQQPVTPTLESLRQLRVKDIKERLQSCCKPAANALERLAVPEADAIHREVTSPHVYPILNKYLRDSGSSLLEALRNPPEKGA